MNNFFSSEINELFRRLNESGLPDSHGNYQSKRRFVGSLLDVMKKFIFRLVYPSLTPLFDSQNRFNSLVIQALNSLRECSAETTHSTENAFSDLNRSISSSLQATGESISQLKDDFLYQNHFRHTEIRNLETTVLGFNHERFWEHRQLEHQLNAQLLDVRTELGNITFTFLHLQKGYEHLAAAEEERKSMQELSQSPIAENLTIQQRDQMDDTVRGLQTAISDRLLVMENAIRNLQSLANESILKVNDLEGHVSTMRKVLLAEDKKPARATARASDAVAAPVAANNRITDMASFDLAERFRGREEEVLERQRHYLKYLNHKSPVLDVGCGRGEMLQLLSGNGTEVIGIDLNQLMVDYCRASGFNAIHSDVIPYLTGNGGTFEAIFAAHFVEHLLPDQLMQFLTLSRERLKEGGLLVIETPNPTGLFTMSASFYLDPTHIRPIHPDALKMMLESMGFRILELKFLSPWPEDVKLKKVDSNGRYPEKSPNPIAANFQRINDILFAPRDYAIVAER